MTHEELIQEINQLPRDKRKALGEAILRSVQQEQPMSDSGSDEDEHADAEHHVKKRPAIFISYNHNENDRAVAARIFDELSPYCDVFLDATRGLGEDFPAVTEDFLNRADFVIALVSPASQARQWVRAELEHVVEREKKEGRPIVIPIRINYEGFPLEQAEVSREEKLAAFHRLRGMLKVEGPPPTDKELKDDYINYLAEKYS
jgi:hypothetical protein